MCDKGASISVTFRKKGYCTAMMKIRGDGAREQIGKFLMAHSKDRTFHFWLYFSMNFFKSFNFLTNHKQDLTIGASTVIPGNVMQLNEHFRINAQ